MKFPPNITALAILKKVKDRQTDRRESVSDDLIDKFLIFLSKSEPGKRLPARRVLAETLQEEGFAHKSPPMREETDPFEIKVDRFLICYSQSEPNESLLSRDGIKEVMRKQD